VIITAAKFGAGQIFGQIKIKEDFLGYWKPNMGRGQKKIKEDFLVRFFGDR
jgi:hypothetical protein